MPENITMALTGERHTARAVLTETNPVAAARANKSERLQTFRPFSFLYNKQSAR